MSAGACLLSMSSSKHSRHQQSKLFWMEAVFRQLVRWQMKSRLVVHAMQRRDPNWESKISMGLTAAWPAWENRDQILSIVPIAFGDIAFTPPFENHLLRSSCDDENPWLFRATCTSYTAFVFFQSNQHLGLCDVHRMVGSFPLGKLIIFPRWKVAESDSKCPCPLLKRFLALLILAVG